MNKNRYRKANLVVHVNLAQLGALKRMTKRARTFWTGGLDLFDVRANKRGSLSEPDYYGSRTVCCSDIFESLGEGNFAKKLRKENRIMKFQKYCSYIESNILLLTFVCLVCSEVHVQAQQSKSFLSIEEVKALIPQIEAAERTLLNIKIESEAWTETKTNLSDPCDPWQRTPIYISSTAWFDGRPRGKAKVDVHKQILEWQEGAAPYIEESYSAGFDGHYGRLAKHTFGHSGRTHHSKRGKLLADAPKVLRTGWCNAFTGIRFSLYFFFNNDRDFSKLSQFLRKITSPDVVKLNAFEFTREEFQGTQCIKIDSAFDRHIVRTTYWLDPSHGFALRGYELVNIQKNGSEWLVSRITVSKLKEASPGVWWPIEASAESGPSRPGKPYRRFVYRASNVVANDPNFDEKIFTVEFPDGYLVDDQVTGRKYKVGGK